jgi:3-phenylpropionate/trans-cinnamate dioxygenase ferredoxin reductase subunit
VQTPSAIVIVGAGHAGSNFAFALRQAGYAGRVVLIDGDAALPYQRPPLSKAYLTGQIEEVGLHFKPAAFYGAHRIERVHGAVSRIDREAACVQLADGRTFHYDHLVLATGAQTRVPDVPGITLQGVLPLRTLDDAVALRPLLAAARNAVVIGAGFIGLEFAAVAARQGLTVHVVELADRPMARAVSPAVSALFINAHRQWGVQWHLGASVREITGANGRATGVIRNDGSLLPADLVVYGIGVLPNDELARQAGLNIGNGIVVDESLRTSDPRISAIGDVAAFMDGDRRHRIESVQNATDQARCLAAGLMGQGAPYRALPWFWSDQGDLKLQIAGLPARCDQFVVHGELSPDQITVLGFRNASLVAVETVNRPADHITAKRALGAGRTLGLAEARTPGFDFKGWARAAA